MDSQNDLQCTFDYFLEIVCHNIAVTVATNCFKITTFLTFLLQFCKFCSKVAKNACILKYSKLSVPRSDHDEDVVSLTNF